MSPISKLSVIHRHHHMLWILGPCSKIHISASRYWAWQPEKQPQPLTTFHEGVGCESKGDEGCRRNGLAEMWTVMKISIIPLTARGPFGKKTKNCPQKKSSDCKKKQKRNPVKYKSEPSPRPTCSDCKKKKKKSSVSILFWVPSWNTNHPIFGDWSGFLNILT